ncbi:MAG TPA: hypothetical protein VMB19_02785 [Silvibacterium sp.]|nr:hypothetical protein [Silvibacterium sp.]
MADGLEYLCPAKVRNQKTKHAARALVSVQYMGTGPGPARNQSQALQFVHGLGYCDTRGKEGFAQLGLTRKAIPRAVNARANRAQEVLEDLAMLRYIDFRELRAARPTRSRGFAGLLHYVTRSGRLEGGGRKVWNV